jgi:hypothetical protein
MQFYEFNISNIKYWQITEDNILCIQRELNKNCVTHKTVRYVYMYWNATFFILLTFCSKSLKCTMKLFSTITSKQ